jgi:23S rRNA (uracil1939-C5)-methyltransferase
VAKPRDGGSAIVSGARLTLAIEKPAAGGRMIARHGGAIVLVSGAIPGEVVEACVEKVQRGTAWARSERVIERSPDRVDTEVDGACGGAVLSHVAYHRQLALKRDILNDAFVRIGKMPLPDGVTVAASPRDGYRMRARLHVQRGKIGFFREGTHTLCDPGLTRQLLPASLDTIARLEAALATDEPHGITDVELSETLDGSARALHLELAGTAGIDEMIRLPALDGVNGISAAAADSVRTATLAGVPFVTDTLTVSAAEGAFSFTLRRHARSFFQANRFLLVDLVTRVVSLIPSGRVLDLYAGVGLFSVALASRGDTDVVAIEGDRHSADDLRHNAMQTAGRLSERHQGVEAFLTVEPVSAWSSAIVDPPRTGMTRDALDGAIGLRVPRLVYVSCDVATLARDARLLVDAGYRLRSLDAFDLFPDTAHVESVALFER